MTCSSALQNLLDFFPHTLCACILSENDASILGYNQRAELFFRLKDIDFDGKRLPQILTKMGAKHTDFILNDPPDGEARTFTLNDRSFISFTKAIQNGDFGLEISEKLHLFFWSEIPFQQGEKYELLLHEFEITLNSIHDGIWIIDGNGMTLHANKALKRIADIRAKDVVGKHVTVPMLEGKFTSCVTLDALAQRKTVTQFDDYSNGNRCLNTSTPILSPDGKVHRVVASIRDMTELEALQHKVAKVEMEALHYKGALAKIEKESNFVGVSPIYHETVRQLKKVAKSASCVLVMGETGTGKSLAASFIHDHSDRSSKPFISINCAAIAESLIDSELFGYEKGAFTGADPQGKKGYFELADGGTLLLDEIGELPLNMQAKLLHVLDNYSFHKVGGNKAIRVNVRIIAATNRPLEELVKTGEFRKDLYYRLHVLTVNIPPLRERPDDIPLLANSFLAEACRRLGTVKVFQSKALLALSAYHWPGNVRELRGAVEYLVAMSESNTIKVEDIRPYILGISEQKSCPFNSHTLLTGDISQNNRALLLSPENTHCNACQHSGVSYEDCLLEAKDVVGQYYKDEIEKCEVHYTEDLHDATSLARETNSPEYNGEYNDGYDDSRKSIVDNGKNAKQPVYVHVPALNHMPTKLNDAVAELEKFMIRNALVQGGSTYKASEILGISQSSVVRKAKALGINL